MAAGEEALDYEVLVNILSSVDICRLTNSLWYDNVLLVKNPNPQHPLTNGLIISLRNITYGLVMRSMMEPPKDGNFAFRLFAAVLYYTSERDRLLWEWSPKDLLAMADSLARKSSTMVPFERACFLNQPLTTILPDHFVDNDIEKAIKLGLQNEPIESLSEPQYNSRLLHTKYALTCGLLIKLRTGMFRVLKRSKLRKYGDIHYATCFYKLVTHFVIDRADVCDKWTIDELFSLADELACKVVSISPKLQNRLFRMPVEATRIRGQDGAIISVRVSFPDDFLADVAAYHVSVSRPAGTFGAALHEKIISAAACASSVAVAFPKKTTAPSAALGDANGVRLEGNESPARASIAGGAAAHEDRKAEEGEGDEGNLLCTLAALPRETCETCNGRRQVYCGSCEGRRMPNAAALLPERVELPFRLLLLVHWHETLHKCTGVHAAALGAVGSVACLAWRKERNWGSWGRFICELRPETDVLLFPSDNAVAADCFDWFCECQCDACVSRSVVGIGGLVPGRGVTATLADGGGERAPTSGHNQEGSLTSSVSKSSSSSNSSGRWEERLEQLRRLQLFECIDDEALCDVLRDADTWLAGRIEGGSNTAEEENRLGKDTCIAGKRRKRLIVLEASWAHGKTMARHIALFREFLGLPALPYVSLQDIVGGYWKFHEEGLSAVSSIEAIAHACAAAGADSATCDTLLFLFRLQKFRVLSRVAEGGRPPKAMNVQGNGIGSWKDLTRGFH